MVRLHEGLVQLWAGDCAAAERTLQRAAHGDLYGYYGTVADNTLHTDLRPGLPIYIPPDGTPGGTVEQLRARVRRHPDDGPSWLGLAYGEEVVGNRRAALAAAQRARAVDPTAVSPRVAVAVLGYDKADPAASFAVLGPLTRRPAIPPRCCSTLGCCSTGAAGHRRRGPVAAGRRSRVRPARSTARSRRQLMRQIS